MVMQVKVKSNGGETGGNGNGQLSPGAIAKIRCMEYPDIVRSIARIRQKHGMETSEGLRDVGGSLSQAGGALNRILMDPSVRGTVPAKLVERIEQLQRELGEVSGGLRAVAKKGEESAPAVVKAVLRELQVEGLRKAPIMDPNGC